MLNTRCLCNFYRKTKKIIGVDYNLLGCVFYLFIHNENRYVTQLAILVKTVKELASLV